MESTISIILPTYNGERCIARAIKSVQSQTYTDWELIVIDDASGDRTASILEKLAQEDKRITLVSNHQNLGIQKSLNKGLSLAKGKYIARIDDDDYWIDDEKLALQVAFLDAHPEYVLVGTDAFVVDEKGETLSKNVMPKPDKDIRSKILSKNCFLHATVMFRKSVIESIGGYDESATARHAEDYDLWLRLGAVGKFENLDLVSTALTARSGSITARNRVLQANNMISVMIKHKKSYPGYMKGLFTSYLRHAFFAIQKYAPLPQSLVYHIQRIYKL